MSEVKANYKVLRVMKDKNGMYHLKLSTLVLSGGLSLVHTVRTVLEPSLVSVDLNIIQIQVIMSNVDKKQILRLIDLYGFEEILLKFNLTPWKVLEILDDLGYVYLEHFDEDI